MCSWQNLAWRVHKTPSPRFFNFNFTPLATISFMSHAADLVSGPCQLYSGGICFGHRLSDRFLQGALAIEVRPRAHRSLREGGRGDRLTMFELSAGWCGE